MLAAIIRATFSQARTESSATLDHGANSYTVVKGYGPMLGVDMAEAGYALESSDLTALLLVDDLETPHPEQNDAVTLDGEDCIVSGPITKTGLYWMLSLKLAR
jgi:hypothetical protein